MNNSPQIKICGLTSPEEALKCAELGADAIGLVFYPKSPRYLTDRQASDISSILPEDKAVVGVFVNESYDTIMKKVDTCGLTAIQLHGSESPELVKRLVKHTLPVIKALYIQGEPNIKIADTYQASAFLVECAKGVLPGGNAMTWNWSSANQLKTDKPLLVAGGLSPDNIKEAIYACEPDVVDVSSGVEKEPGKKDLSRAEAFIRAVSDCNIKKTLRSIF